jgi:nitroreductase
MKYPELLKNRRSIRNFEEREVDIDVIREIIKESTLAPSASNGQPWRFIIINNREVIRRLSDESKKNLLADMRDNPEAPGKNYEGVLKLDNFNVFYNAPCLIIIAGPRRRRHLHFDLALCASYIMFGAASRGLGTCWVAMGTAIRDPGLRAEIGLPEDFEPHVPVILGYPKLIPTAPPRNEPAILKVIP